MMKLIPFQSLASAAVWGSSGGTSNTWASDGAWGAKPGASAGFWDDTPQPATNNISNNKKKAAKKAAQAAAQAQAQK